jgi:hypothetical protein
MLCGCVCSDLTLLCARNICHVVSVVKLAELRYLIDGASTPIRASCYVKLLPVPSSGGKSKPHSAAGLLLPSTHVHGNDVSSIKRNVERPASLSALYCNS